jgi:Uri superfamily endonuclease
MNFNTNWKNYETDKIDDKYLNGKVYQIIVKGKILYIGSTTLSLKDRLMRHRSASKIRHSPFYKYIHDNNLLSNMEIEIIQQVPCINKSELITFESKCINSIGFDKLLNKNRP